MKYIKFLSILLFYFVTLNNSDAQRNVILTHGFGGDSSTWKVYHPKLTQMLPTATVGIVNYDSHQGVDAGSNEVQRQVANNSRNIVVAHSMGGLVWRNLDNRPGQAGQKAGGIITLGTPNRGGAAMNAMRDGRLQAEGLATCNKFQGVILLAGNIVRLLNAISVPSVGAGSPIDNLKSFFCTDIIDLVNSQLPVTTAPQSVIDMSEGSNIVNQLSITNSNTPTFKIGVFGTEQSPVHFRLLSSARNSPTHRPLDVIDTDQGLVDGFNAVQSILAGIEAVFFAIASTCFYHAFATWNFVLLIVGVAFLWGAYETADLRRWLSQSETRWNALIGAGGFFTELRNMRVFTCRERMDMIYDLWERRIISAADMRLVRGNLLTDPNCFQMMATPVLFPINNQSDGLFHAGAARIPEDPNSIDHVVNLEVEHANHQELVNHSNMTALFEDIFAGRTKANLFFVTR